LVTLKGGKGWEKRLFSPKIVFICLTEREGASRGSGRQREKAGSLLSREPDPGLDPRTSRP